MNNENVGESKIQEFKLEEDQELRFEVPSGEVLVELLEGTAEVFGSELVTHKRYAFAAGARVAVFTWHGCKVELVGETEGAYVAKMTPMVMYGNTHAALEQMRQKAEKQNGRGPRLMVTGPTDVGKSTYCRILCNYALRLGRCPTYVDLDVGQGSVSVPGTIGALYLERPADPVEGFDKTSPLVFNFGALSPDKNIPLHDALVAKVAEFVNGRCEINKAANAGGVIVNTCGWIKGNGYQCLVNAAAAFEVDVVIVIDHERLFNDLQRDLPAVVKIVHQPKSGGVEERSRQVRISSRRERIRRYFYGTSKQPYNPFSFHIRFDEVQIYKIGVPMLPDSCMPLGMKAEDTSTKLVQIHPGPQFVHHLLAVSLCETAEEDLVKTNVAGFVCVVEVNTEKQTMTILSPQPYPLPRKFLLWSEVTFEDVHLG